MNNEPKDVGQILKAEREKRALSLDVVHETTKIPMDSLRAIEEGYKIRTLSTFYYKSFVRIYAKYLGMDADKIAGMIPSVHPAPKASPADPKPLSVKKPLSQVQKEQNLNLFARQGDGRQGRKVIKILVFLFLGIGLIALAVAGVQKIRQGKAPGSSVEVQKKTSPKPPKVKAEALKKSETPRTAGQQAPSVAKKGVSSETTAQEQPGQKVSRKVSLTVRARTTTVWLKVKVDGATVFQGSLKKNNHVSWDGQKSIELSGKDIDQLDYEANGKMVGKIGRPNSRIKKVVVTPEGLSVEK